MDSYSLMSGDHFHVILHSDKQHGLIFNRLDGTVTTINHDDARELINLKPMGTVYGIIGRFLDRYLVLIKNRSRIGSLYEPKSKTEHEIYVVTQVRVIDITHASIVTSNSHQGGNSMNTATKTESVKYDVVASAKNDESLPQDSVRPIDEEFSSLPITISTNNYASIQNRSNNWNPFKIASSLKPIMSSQFLKSSSASSSGPGSVVASVTSETTSANDNNINQSVNCTQDDADRRLVEEMMKLFNNTNSFYYSPTLDLTNRFSNNTSTHSAGKDTFWQTADERFFWNKYMLKDLIELSKTDKAVNYFICVILQGFIAIQQHSTVPDIFNDIGGEETGNGIPATSINSNHAYFEYSSSGDKSSNYNTDNCDEMTRDGSSTVSGDKLGSRTYKLALVSRRSVFQAGTRYRRRGCDDQGNCANFVETEQIFSCNNHFTSFIILRGSIPLYWYQTGFNYRPPPVLFRSEDENHAAFTKHFESLFHLYRCKKIIVVDCTEQSGREKVLHDSFKRHMGKLSELYAGARLIEFDFHKYCKGRQISDSQVERHLRACGLTDQILKEARYYWNDGEPLWEQDGVFRVNCLDCSDRTNVVQRSIALQVLDQQLARLGIIAPDTCPEDNQCRKIMQSMWSTNGNVLSTQYCGTHALFGNDKKLAGYLKDTYSSASRYYIGKFRDAYRQAAIDAMLGVENSEDRSQLKAENFKDQYELLSFDPILAGRTGGALLKDVGSRFSNRLARLKGKFHVQPSYEVGTADDIMCMRQSAYMEAHNSQINETGLIDTLGEMSIDWPSSESVPESAAGIPLASGLDRRVGCEPLQTINKTSEAVEAVERVTEPVSRDVFAQFASHCNDSFHDDDEFGQLMLSTDLAELQRLQDDRSDRTLDKTMANDDSNEGQTVGEKRAVSEEIDMTETRGSIKQAISETHDSNKVNTTSA